jgi:hypothetical protein
MAQINMATSSHIAAGIRFNAFIAGSRLRTRPWFQCHQDSLFVPHPHLY